MNGLKIGHFMDKINGTGLTVFLLEDGAVGAYMLCGSGPASRELAVLDPEVSVPNLQALMFTGGSAFGLNASQGVMDYLTERNIGHPTIAGVVPIVPAAAIFDLAYKKSVIPTPLQAYEACKIASENNVETGSIGAGSGAMVGKLIPNAKRMKGGLGYAKMQLPNDIEVMAYVVVNSIGDIRDSQGNFVAGARDDQGNFANCEAFLLAGNTEKNLFSQSHSTLAVVFTNAKFSKAELKRIAKAAIAGIARAVFPVFTRYDGDILFCVSVGEKIASELTIGTIAAEVVRLAILDAVKDSEIIS